jgi:hypothetical protein
MVRTQSRSENILKLAIHSLLRIDSDCPEEITSTEFSTFSLRPLAAGYRRRANRTTRNHHSKIRHIRRLAGVTSNHRRNGLRLSSRVPQERTIGPNGKFKAVAHSSITSLCLSQANYLRPAPRRAALPRTAESAHGMDCRRVAAASDTRWYARGCGRRSAGQLVLASHDNGLLRNEFAGWGRAYFGGQRFSSARPRSFDSQRNTKNPARSVCAAHVSDGYLTGRASLCTQTNFDIRMAALSAVFLRAVPQDRRGSRREMRCFVTYHLRMGSCQNRAKSGLSSHIGRNLQTGVPTRTIRGKIIFDNIVQCPIDRIVQYIRITSVAPIDGQKNIHTQRGSIGATTIKPLLGFFIGIFRGLPVGPDGENSCGRIAPSSTHQSYLFTRKDFIR